MAKEDKEKKIKERFIVGQVATQTAPVVIDTAEDDEEKKTLTLEQAMARVLNNTEQLKQLLE